MLTIAVGTDVSAHRRDEYLQAARFAIAPTHVELQLDLTPGIAVAETIIAEIDRDRDGSLSADETRAYIGLVLRTIDLDVDGQSLHLQPIASSFPTVEAIRRGEGTILLQLDATLPRLLDGAHHLVYRNTHHRDISAYLANALVPDTDRVVVKAQLRDIDQHDLTIDYLLRAGPETSASSRDWWLGGGFGVALLIMLLLRYQERQPSRRLWALLPYAPKANLNGPIRK